MNNTLFFSDDLLFFSLGPMTNSYSLKMSLSSHNGRLCSPWRKRETTLILLIYWKVLVRGAVHLEESRVTLLERLKESGYFGWWTELVAVALQFVSPKAAQNEPTISVTHTSCSILEWNCWTWYLPDITHFPAYVHIQRLHTRQVSPLICIN